MTKYKKVICKIDTRDCIEDEQGYGTCGDMIDECPWTEKILKQNQKV